MNCPVDCDPTPSRSRGAEHDDNLATGGDKLVRNLWGRQFIQNRELGFPFLTKAGTPESTRVNSVDSRTSEDEDFIVANGGDVAHNLV